MQIKIIKDDDKYDFEEQVNKAIYKKVIQDIKFSVAPDIHSGNFGGSYSAGETYYAMIIYEN